MTRYLDVLIKGALFFHELFQLSLRRSVYQPVIVCNCRVKKGSKND